MATPWHRGRRSRKWSNGESFCFVQCHVLQLGNTETLLISIGTLQPLNEAVPSAPLPLGCILKSHSRMLLTPYRNTSELFTPWRSVLWEPVLWPRSASTSNAPNGGLLWKLCLMAAVWRAQNSARVFQVPFPLGIVNLFISWKTEFCSFVFDISFQANKSEWWNNPKSWNEKKSEPVWQSRFKDS